MRKLPMPGDAVHFVDSTGKVHNALVTAAFVGFKNEKDAAGNWIPITTLEEYEAMYGVGRMPSINSVYVDDDANRQDSYGRQITRATSCCHKLYTQAWGYYWKWPEEEPNPIAPAIK